MTEPRQLSAFDEAVQAVADRHGQHHLGTIKGHALMLAHKRNCSATDAAIQVLAWSDEGLSLSKIGVECKP